MDHQHIRRSRCPGNLCFSDIERCHPFATDTEHEEHLCRQRHEMLACKYPDGEGSGCRQGDCSPSKEECCRNHRNNSILESGIQHVPVVVRRDDPDVCNTDKSTKQGEVKKITCAHGSKRCKAAGYRHKTLKPEVSDSDIFRQVSICPKYD